MFEGRFVTSQTTCAMKTVRVMGHEDQLKRRYVNELLNSIYV